MDREYQAELQRIAVEAELKRRAFAEELNKNKKPKKLTVEEKLELYRQQAREREKEYPEYYRPLGPDTIAWPYGDRINARTCVMYLLLLNERSGRKVTVRPEAWVKRMRQLLDEYGQEKVKDTLIGLLKVKDFASSFKGIGYLEMVLKNGNKTKP